MKIITTKEIRTWEPCYPPTKYLSEDWAGTAIDLLNIKEIPFGDRLWVILRSEVVSEKFMRIFAVWCARQVQHLMKDQRSIDALDFMDAYIENYWLIDCADWRQRWAAARDAAWDAARAAAWAAADAAADAAWAAARDAAWDAARAAAWAAARAAADAARDAQEAKLKEMLTEGISTGDVF